MGSWMARFLSSQGHDVSVLDPSPQPTTFADAESLSEASEVDLVVVAVPMTECGSLLAELAEIDTDAVVAEMCSLKGHLVPAIDQARLRGLRVVSFHPLFGPEERMLSGRTIVFCPDAPPQDLELVRGLFEATSARMIELSIEEHDRRMGLVLGLTHLNNLVFARSLMQSGLSAEEMAGSAGVTFRKQLETTREVSAENPDLYFQIQSLNDLTGQTGRWLHQAVDEWMATIESKESDAFHQLMTDCRDYLAGADTILAELAT